MAKEHGYCMVSVAPVRVDKKDQSEIVTQLLFGEVVSILELSHPWAKISTFTDGYEGWIDFKHVRLISDKEMKRWLNGLSYSKDKTRNLQTPWGIQSIYRGSSIPEGMNAFAIGQDEFKWLEEEKNENTTVLDFAKDYINTSYLWGGKTPFGIDCSGLTQVIYRFAGFNLPRDAFEQVTIGATVEFKDIEAGDLAYFENSLGKITHVGICNNQGEIIHASGHVRVDQLTELGIINSDSGDLTHKLTTIKRL
jgi:hypothetical protein